MSSGSTPSRWRRRTPTRSKGGNGARLCPPDQLQRLRKSGDQEIIPTSCKFRGAAAGLCHSRAPDNSVGILRRRDRVTPPLPIAVILAGRSPSDQALLSVRPNAGFCRWRWSVTAGWPKDSERRRVESAIARAFFNPLTGCDFLPIPWHLVCWQPSQLESKECS